MVKDTALYDILGVAPEATDIELKKAYRKKAIQFHPDKNKDEGAEAMFKEVGEAYQILSNPDTRSFYDKVGKAGMDKTGDGAQEMDPKEIFGKIFGGEAFEDYIGEIALVKDFTSTMDVVMTEEEKAEMEAAATEDSSSVPTAAGATTAGTFAAASASVPRTSAGANTAPTPAAAGVATPAPGTDLAHHTSFNSLPSGATTPEGTSDKVSGSTIGSAGASKDAAAAKKAKAKLSPEQKAKLAELEEAKDKNRAKRVDTLAKKLVLRIRPFVDAKHPGDPKDPETAAFEAKIKIEGEDLKLESFGVELLHTIAHVYSTKATNFLKSKKFFGGAFLGRMKEKGSMVKEGWGLLGSAIGVQQAMEQMQRLEVSETATPEEMEAMAQDLSTKMLLTTWKATRWEVINIVGDVVEQVLHELGQPKEQAINRAKAILSIAAVFKNVQADESDDERRELERLVLGAGNKKKAKAEKDKKEGGTGWGWGHAHGHKRETAPAASVETEK